MAQHGNRSAQHEREIRKFVDTANLENHLEERYEEKETENYLETKARERTNGHSLTPELNSKEK